MENSSVVIIGAGIAGLTSAALLANEGISVILLESHHQAGGCAGTFRRGPWTFDVGATQVAGLEPGGIHKKLFNHLNIPLPKAQPLDPGCVVDLRDGLTPISLWHDPQRWQEECLKQFPGSERFWSICQKIHKINWAFNERNPIISPRSIWDLKQLIGALRPLTLTSGLITGITISDLLWLCGCSKDRRLKNFLDLQLKLYSQQPANRTAALYGATVLQIAQSPHGLWHLYGSMQILSDLLHKAIEEKGGTILLQHRVTKLTQTKKGWLVNADKKNNISSQYQADDVICSLPPQCLPNLLGKTLPASYLRRLINLPKPSGAIVLYGVIKRDLSASKLPFHLQLAAKSIGPIFISISQEGDGRAPVGQATVIASMFTNTNDWNELPASSYKKRKKEILSSLISELNSSLKLNYNSWLHFELATPRGFSNWTGRPKGIVGGLGQHPLSFGPFSLASRTPMEGLWLCGDSIHPGEGTAGVSLSALTTCRQLLAKRGKKLIIKS